MHSVAPIRKDNLFSSIAKTGQVSSHDQLVKQTQKWVSQTFYGQLLKQMRDSPFRNSVMDGGRGGQAFGSMFDQHLAERMSTGSGKKLVDAIVKKIEAKQAYAKQQRAQQTQQTLAVPKAASPSGAGSQQQHPQQHPHKRPRFNQFGGAIPSGKTRKSW